MRLPSNIDDIKNISDFNEKINEARRVNLARELVGNDASFDLVKEVADKFPDYIPENASIAQNMGEAKNMGPKELYDAVKNKGKWDYKQQSKFGLYEEFGNSNYAAVTRASGLPDIIAKIGAGYAQIAAGTSPLKKEIFGWSQGKLGLPPEKGVSLGDFLFDPNFGDDPRDQVPMKRIWDMLDKLEQQNSEETSDSKTRIDVPKNDSEEMSDLPDRRVP